MTHGRNTRRHPPNRRRRYNPPAKKSWTFPPLLTWTIMALAGYGAYTLFVQLTS